MSSAEHEAGRAALREVIETLAATMPPLSPEDEARIQRSMRRDDLLHALSTALLAKDEAAVVNAKQALTDFDGVRWP